jgi:UDPglucose 6-dehydrogenase
MERAREVLPAKNVTYAGSAYEAARGADALLILTEWPEFASLDLSRLKAALAYPIVLDGRNLLDPELMSAHGFLYHSIGRPDPAHPLRTEVKV